MTSDVPIRFATRGSISSILWHNINVKVVWSQSARKHRIGKARALEAMADAEITAVETKRGEPALLYIGIDGRGIELEIIGVPLGDALLIIHCMPTAFRATRSRKENDDEG